MTKISTLSDQPFSFPSKNVIFGVEIMIFFIPVQNFGIFASPTKGMDTFLFEMSMKRMFTFKNFRNVYWHAKTHSAMVKIELDKNEIGAERNSKVKNKRKWETLALNDIMLNGKTKDFSKIRTCNSKLSYTNREINSNTFLLVLIPLKEQKGQKFPN